VAPTFNYRFDVVTTSKQRRLNVWCRLGSFLNYTSRIVVVRTI